jgi:mRNA degradation ribonuclease J1/J2
MNGQTKAELKIIPLGGLGEIGLKMIVFFNFGRATLR